MAAERKEVNRARNWISPRHEDRLWNKVAKLDFNIDRMRLSKAESRYCAARCKHRMAKIALDFEELLNELGRKTNGGTIFMRRQVHKQDNPGDVIYYKDNGRYGKRVDREWILRKGKKVMDDWREGVKIYVNPINDEGCDDERCGV